MSGLPSWQETVWRSLVADRARLPHALLLHGPRGTGKRAFALALTRFLLCAAPEGQRACGRCPSCHLFDVGNHPDFRLIEPVEGEEGEQDRRGGRVITIAQIRSLEDFLGLSTHQQGPRVILIHPAEAMNPAAANALLKTLEEPADNTVFLLVSHQPRHLLPTVISRCRQVALPLPGRAEALAWLKDQGVEEAGLCLALAGGAPFEALRYADAETLAARRAFLSALGEPARLDWLRLAEQGARQDLATLLEWLQKWLYDLVALNLAGSVRYNPDFAARLRELCRGVNVKALLRLARQLEAVRRHVHHPLNVQLLLESLFAAYSGVMKRQDG